MMLFKKIIRTLTEFRNKLIIKKKNIISKVSDIKTVTKSFSESGLIKKSDFVKLPDGLCDKTFEKSRFLVKAGITLMFPFDALKWYFGKVLDFQPMFNKYKDCEGLRVEVKQVIFITNKLTRVTIEITNIGDKNQMNFNTNDNEKFKECIELKINGIDRVEFQTVNDRQLSNNKILNPNQFKEIEIIFSYLDESIIRRIKNINIKYTHSYRNKIKEFEFSFVIPKTDLQKLKNRIIDEFNLTSFFEVLSYGGFIFIAIILNLIIRFIGNIIGGYFIIISFILSIIIFIFAVNLNYKFISIVFDFLSKGENKD